MSDLITKGFKLPVLGASAPSGSGMTRRGFLQVLGATSVATLAAGCARPEQDTIKPYVSTPDDVVPGNALHYATSYTLGGVATGLLVTAYEGRPTKIEGNPRHPYTLGATGPIEQASVLSLYDPTRIKDISHKGTAVSRESLFAMLRQKAAAFARDGGAGLRLLLEPSSSPLLGEQLAALKKRFPNAVVRFYNPAATDAVAQGATLAFGRPVHARYELKNADVIVSLGADFLAATAENLRYNWDWAERRADAEKLNRLYVAETDHTLTGSNADHRFPMKPTEVGLFARALLARVGQQRGGAAGVDSRGPASVEEKALAAVAKDLVGAAGRSLVIAGERQPAAVHAIAHALNQLLGNVGKTVVYTASPLLDANVGPSSLKATIDDIAKGGVDTLIVTAYNPVWARPADLDVEAALAKVPNTVYMALNDDMTAHKAAWVVPAAHALETWGDARAADGTVSIVQPLINTLYNSVTTEGLLSAMLDPSPRSAHDLIRDRYRKLAGSQDPEAYWEKVLRQGFLEDTALPAENVTANVDAAANAARALPAPAGNGYELNLRLDYKLYDGRFGHNPWLLELPDPVTKLVWDNAALISPNTAKALKVDREFMIDLSAGSAKIRVPVYIVPGHADGAITLPVGWGLPEATDVAVNRDIDPFLEEDRIGFNAYPFTTLASQGLVASVDVKTTDDRYPLAATQVADPDNYALSQHGRDLAMIFDVSEREKIVERLERLRSEKLPTMYEVVKYDGYKWGMGVDLSRCTGCSACVVACVSENNIPMVGKDGVRRGREMHWLRIDRYYEGDEKNPRVVQQPVACVHCENAPCEYVCPVNATVHDEEGLNAMVYNRCIGTRYCSNNCPYKVRRFNFFAYNNDVTPVEELSKNPNVTVRARGVMEKCTYCVQRIESARINTEINQLPTIRVAGSKAPTDPDVLERAKKVPMLQTACQQACPTGAIVFGNLNDPDATVTKLHADGRRYDLLNTLGTRPRTGYLARLTNRNPELA